MCSCPSMSLKRYVSKDSNVMNPNHSHLSLSTEPSATTIIRECVSPCLMMLSPAGYTSLVMRLAISFKCASEQNMNQLTSFSESIHLFISSVPIHAYSIPITIHSGSRVLVRVIPASITLIMILCSSSASSKCTLTLSTLIIYWLISRIKYRLSIACCALPV
jgi:hypothetical protein